VRFGRFEFAREPLACDLAIVGVAKKEAGASAPKELGGEELARDVAVVRDG
jgi:hypothetical protein